MFIHQSNFLVKSQLQAKSEVIRRAYDYLTKALNIWSEGPTLDILTFISVLTFCPVSPEPLDIEKKLKALLNADYLRNILSTLYL